MSIFYISFFLIPFFKNQIHLLVTIISISISISVFDSFFQHESFYYTTFIGIYDIILEKKNNHQTNNNNV